MMTRLPLLTSLLIALSIPASISHAQVDPGVGESEPQDSAPVREPTLYEFTTTGFDFDLDLFQEPVVRESSNTSQYAVTIQRRAGDGLALGTDGLMAFVRMTQTIEPLDDADTAELLQQATLEDAIRSIRNAYGELNQLETTPVTYEFLGEMRQGTRIDVGYLEIGVNVYVECYSFINDAGNGVGIIIKYHEPVDDEVSRDLILVDQLLAGLSVKPISRVSYYNQTLGDYQIRIPVISSLKNAKKLNKFVTEATIAYEFGSLRFQMIEVPENVDATQVATDQLRGYEGALNQQQERGQIEILWSNHTTVPAGESGDTVLTGLTHAVRMNDQEFLSTMYTTVDDNRVVVSNFSGAIERANMLHEYASEFFHRPLSTSQSPFGTDIVGAIEVSRPRGLYLHRVTPQSVVYGASDKADLDNVYSDLRSSDAGYYQISILDKSPSTLAEHLTELLPSDFETEEEQAPDVVLHELSDGRQAEHLTFQGSVTDTDGNRVNVHVSGYLVPLSDTGTRVLVSAVSPSESHRASTITAESLLERITSTLTPGITKLSFATLKYNPADTSVTRVHLPDTSHETRVMSELGSMTIRVDKDLSDGIAGSDLIHATKSILNHEDLELDTLEVQDVDFHGHSAQQIKSVQDDQSYIAIGFPIEDAFVVIVVESDAAESNAIDSLLSLLHFE